MLKYRVESANSVLKRCVESSVGDFVCVFKAIDLVLTDQISEVKISMGRALNTWPTTQEDLWVFGRVRNIVSKECFYHLVTIYNDLLKNGCTEECKDGFWRISFGLPCTHEIQASIDGKTPIRPSQIHRFGKTLDWKGVVIEDPSDNVVLTSGQITIQRLIANYESGEMDEETQWRIASSYNDADNPISTNMVTPDPSGRRLVGRPRGRNMKPATDKSSYTCPLKSETRQHEFQKEQDRGRGRRGKARGARGDTRTERRGRGRRNAEEAGSTNFKQPEHEDMGSEELDGFGSSPFFKHLSFDWGTNNVDSFMMPFIRKVVNVSGDGHCEYRAFPQLLDWEQDPWPAIRMALVAEMIEHADRYSY